MDGVHLSVGYAAGYGAAQSVIPPAEDMPSADASRAGAPRAGLADRLLERLDRCFLDEQLQSERAVIVYEGSVPLVNNRSNAASSAVGTPSSTALAALVPGSLPTTTTLVFLLTLDVTLPPRSSTACLASSRV